MINQILLTIITLFSTIASANSNSSIYRKLPENVVCTSQALSRSVQKFEIHNLNTNSPDSTIEDSAFMNTAITNDRLNIGFSNECDNSYEVNFTVSDLILLKAGKTKHINAVMAYSDQRSTDIYSPTGVAEETIWISCTLE